LPPRSVSGLLVLRTL
jgi:hypothetical protein